MIELEFDSDIGYHLVSDKKVLEFEDYMDQPVVYWLHTKVGEMKWPRDVNEILHGDGWEISADWANWMYDTSQKPRTCAIIHKDINPQLVTEFWIRFQR